MLSKRKGDKTKVSNHFRAVISIQLCILGISIGGLWVYWIANEPIPFIGGLLVGALVSITNAINVMSGKPYINPFFKSLNVS